MKRRDFLKVGGVGLAASAVAAPAIAQSNPEIKWRYTASWPKALDTLYGGCEYFAKRVAEITDNKFQIQPFAAGEIVPGLQVLDAVSNGTVEMGNTALYYYWVRLFGMTKSLAKNLSELSLELNGARRVKDLVVLLDAEYPQIGELIHKKKVLVSVNQEIAHEETDIQDGDEVALLPPFAGGTHMDQAR